MDGSKPNLAVFLAHPIMHFVPLWVSLTQRGRIGVEVFYYSLMNVGHKVDIGFGQPVQFDVPLLDGYSYQVLPKIWGRRDKCPVFGLNGEIAEVLRSRRYDMAMCTGYALLNNIWLACACRLHGVPLIFQSDSTLLQPRSLLRRAAKCILVPLFYRQVSHFLAIGDHNHRYLRAYGVPEDKITFSPIPVDVSRFQMSLGDFAERRPSLFKRYRIPEGAKVIVFCGTLVSRKRPVDLALAMQRLRASNAVALYVGDGPLRGEVERAGGDRVRITGFVNQSEIPLHFALGDLLVMPSEYDPHPLVATEAAVMGLPLVLSDRCGCEGPHDLARSGQNAGVYPVGDIQALAGILDDLLADPVRLMRMSERSRELAKTQSPSVAAETIEEVVLSLKRKRS